ncbi:MAG: hypothetical protein JWR75_1952 [Devosia sp.]|nr:hypothetical protein [Devosia sp.]
MPDRFAESLDQLLLHEGGFVDHPQDPGGATNLGITRKTLARWRRVSPWWGLPVAEVKALRRAEAAAIYAADYWKPVHAGELPPGIDLAVFDFAVNSGPARAAKTLQGVLGVTADGRIGPATLAAVKARVALYGAAGLIDALSGRRLQFLTRLATFATFGRGWTRRVEAIRVAARAAAGSSPDVQQRETTPMDVFTGYRTYLIAASMVLAGLAQLLGIDLPALDGQSAGQLIMEAVAIIFLRKGIKSDISNA